MEYRPRFRQDRRSHEATLRDPGAGGNHLSTSGSAYASRRANSRWLAGQRPVYPPSDLPSTANSESVPEDTDPVGHLPSSIGRLSLKSSEGITRTMALGVFGESTTRGLVKQEKRSSELPYVQRGRNIRGSTELLEEEEENANSAAQYLSRMDKGPTRSLPPAPKIDTSEGSRSQEQLLEEDERRRERLRYNPWSAIGSEREVYYDDGLAPRPPRLRRRRSSPSLEEDRHISIRRKDPPPGWDLRPAFRRRQPSVDTFDNRPTRDYEEVDNGWERYGLGPEESVSVSKMSINDASGAAFGTRPVNFTISKDSSADDCVRQAKLLAEMGERSQRIRNGNHTESISAESRTYMKDADDDGNTIDDTSTYVSVVPPNPRFKETTNVSRTYEEDSDDKWKPKRRHKDIYL